MRPEVLQQAIDTYGSRAQEEMAIEEMSELTKAIVKRHRAKDKPSYDKAMSNIRKEQRQQEAAERLAVISRLIPVMKQTAELAGFEVVGRITLKDKETGKEYR